MLKKAILALADGTVFEGLSFGADGEACGEVVFNTSLTGYQEVLTDPSYKGQMVTMTYSQQGNYGINAEDMESIRPWVEGFIVKEPCLFPSNWRSTESLMGYLIRNRIVGISGIDTRALTRIIRDKGAMQGIISTVDGDHARLVRKAQSAPSLVGRDLVKEVTCAKAYDWHGELWDLDKGGYPKTDNAKKKFRVVAYDFGVKKNILRNLASAGCDVTVVPASTPAEEVLALNPNGIFLSNGPGDPEAVSYARETVGKLIGKRPIFGICLGHQILSLAIGGRTYKLKFGHRGSNQPVQDLTTSKVEITSQNHGFAVDIDSLKGIADLTHINLNDRTCEGIALKGKPVFSVQYHPEASPGPHDSQYLFRRFTEMMEANS
ncbi:MAG TPA: carbamoyl phosphate synthase small subunit [Deltaproteobacteria bacterium]|nr:MAG: carbamoyl phosphate synthase small subunit [Deltaproteobacteria bacterium GWA2_55_82]OGQ63245.1 MAG: carbamoyl phosphate synthase small subunit [Deltaproteobacteria bacterium RIFCSPLOWO2_02_FULL_55_12]OIJ73080.1 MAG: carbamoyl phosphate synthase small subunit [Deltaproteobacteria bacterium GWC2_55_46]HBG47842.1 carbamoyl phosphate synthase small subunit [Deltaproteobacteria bacterium]HCY11895.1 carbamoyl phosphate synthase small subunit [Deltaproteobacteria bacterium]